MAWHKLITFIGTWRKQRKTSTSASLTALKHLTMWITTNCGKFLKRWEYQTILPVSWETCMWVKKQQLELDMEQLTGSKFGKQYVKAVCCHSAYITSMQSNPTHWKRPWWWKRLKTGGEGTTEDEIVRWHHCLNGHKSEQAPGDGEEQESLACCSL